VGSPAIRGSDCPVVSGFFRRISPGTTSPATPPDVPGTWSGTCCHPPWEANQSLSPAQPNPNAGQHQLAKGNRCPTRRSYHRSLPLDADSTTALTPVCAVKDRRFRPILLLPGDCKAAADHLPRHRSLGLAQFSRQPSSLHRANHGGGSRVRPARILFSRHYDVQPVDPLSLGTVSLRPAVTDSCRRSKDHRRRARGHKGQFRLRRSLPGLESVPARCRSN